MAFPTGWGRKCAVTISSTYVSGTSHTDFPILVTEDMLPSEMFDADGSYPALSGGGDVRFSSDSAGSTQLACEIVSFVTDNNPANGSAEIWVKVPTLSGSTDTTIYVWYNKTGETQPAVTDTYGRDAVWSDYIAVYHGELDGSNDLIDSTGSYAAAGSPAVDSGNQVTGIIGDAVTIDSDEYFTANASGRGHGDLTLQGWIDYDGSSLTRIPAIGDTSTPSLHRQAFLSDGKGGSYQHAYGANVLRADTTQVATSAGWYLLHATYYNNNDSVAAFVDGGNKATFTGVGGNVSSHDEIWIGYLGDSTPVYSGVSYAGDEFRLREANLSDDWIATEYNNQNSPSTFATAGTPESVGGATYTVYFAVYESTDPDPTAGADLVSGSAWATSYAVSLANETPPASTTVGDLSPELTGLTAGQSYKAAAVLHDGTSFGTVLLTGVFRTAYDHAETFGGALTTGGNFAPVITYALDAAGALQSGGNLADAFGAGAVTYTETLDGALQSGGDLIPVVGYGLALDGLMQSGGNLVDTLTTPGNYSETFSGALTTGGDLVPVLSSSIAAIGSLDTGGDLVVFVSYAQSIDGLLQTGGDMADTFTDAGGAWSEAMAGALTTGGDLVPLAQWGVLVDGVLVVGGNLADAQVSLEGEDITGLDIEYKAIQAIYKTAVAIGAQYRKAGQAATPIRVAPISDDLAQLGAAELGIRGLIRSVTVRTSDVATPSRGDYVSFRNTTYRVAEYRRISEYEWQLYVSA